MKKQFLSILAAGLMLGGTSQIKAMTFAELVAANVGAFAVGVMSYDCSKWRRERRIQRHSLMHKCYSRSDMAEMYKTDPDSDGEQHAILVTPGKSDEGAIELLVVYHFLKKLGGATDGVLNQGTILKTHSLVAPYYNEILDACYVDRVRNQITELLATYVPMVEQWKQYKFQPMMLAGPIDNVTGIYSAITLKERFYGIDRGLLKYEIGDLYNIADLPDEPIHGLQINLERRRKSSSANNPDVIVNFQPLTFVPLPKVKDGETPEQYKMRASNRAILLAKKYVKEHFANGMDDIKSITMFDGDITKLWRTL